MDEIDKVQQNNLLPFEQSKKDEVVQSLQRDVDDIGITLQWWMNDFRESWETEYPRAVEQLSDEHWETWYTNFKNFTRQDIKYCFNEIRKTPRDFPPNLSHLYNLTQNNAQTRPSVDSIGSDDRCQDKQYSTCNYGNPHWLMNKFGEYEFIHFCVMSCEKYIKAYPNEYEQNQKPEPMTKGRWFEMVSDFMSNTDEEVFNHGFTQADRKVRTWEYCELMKDGNLKEVLEMRGHDTNMSFKDISKLMRKLPKRKSLGYGLDQ